MSRKKESSAAMSARILATKNTTISAPNSLRRAMSEALRSTYRRRFSSLHLLELYAVLLNPSVSSAGVGARSSL